MSYGPVRKFSVVIASGASTSSQLDTGGEYLRHGALYYGTMSTGALVTVYGSDSSEGSFYPVNGVTIATSLSGQWGTFTPPPHRYWKFVTSAVVSGGVSFTAICNG